METTDLALHHLQALLDHNSDCLWETDAQGHYTYASRVMHDQLGYVPADVVGKSPLDFMAPAERERMQPVFADIIRAQRSFKGLINRNLHAQGHPVVLETSGVPLRDADGQLCGFRGISRDVSTLGERVLQIEAAYEYAPVALSIVQLDGTVVLGNRSMAQLAGVAQDAIAGANMNTLMPAPWHDLMADLPAPHAPLHMQPRELQWHQQWLRVTPQPLPDADNHIRGLFIAWMDITDRKRAEDQLTQANAQLARYAQQDYLTGLYNRRMLDEQLATEIARARRDAQPLSLVMVDVDYFKAYNDSQGHLAGDECLRTLAQVLSASVRRPADTVSRYGGEEFVLILPNTDSTGAHAVAEGIRRQVHALALPHPSSPLGHVTISAGAITQQAPSASAQRGHKAPFTDAAQALLRQADQALYTAKNSGRNQVISQIAA